MQIKTASRLDVLGAQTPLTIAIVAGESSGDQLGSRLIENIVLSTSQSITFIGVGGPLMVQSGLQSLFPMSDIAVNGLIPVIKKLPTLLRRISQTARAIIEAKPACVVLIDAQDFNKKVAKAVRKALPHVPIIGYVSPTVWAWRPGRAKKIRPLFNKLMAVLPFEPEVHQRLGGPETIYVGHPLMERSDDWISSTEEASNLAKQPYKLLVLPGSRQGEISRLLPVFGEAVGVLAKTFPNLEVVLPAVDHLRAEIEIATSLWPIRPKLVVGESEKWHAFRTARAALAASGTVTLELALAKVPTVVAYRVSYIEGEIARRMIKVDFASLPNIILGRELMKEFIERGWTGVELAASLVPLLRDGDLRDAQLKAFDEVRTAMSVSHGSPSAMAAAIVLDAIRNTKKEP
jgi:lipid-A-disaccharide synthase